MRRVVKGEKKPEKKDDSVKIGFDTVNEVVLIAAVVSDEKARKRYLQTPPDYFRGSGHATMWAGLQELYRRGLEYSPDTLKELVGDDLDVKALDEIVRARPEAPPNLSLHVDRLRWHKARYDAATGPVTAFLEVFRDTSSDPELVKQKARQLAECFAGQGDLRYLRDSQALVKEHAIELTTRRLGRATYRYGIKGLDLYGEGETKVENGKSISLAGHPRMIPGTAPGELTVVVGRSGNGKTTGLARMVLSMVQPPVGVEARRVMWGSWEQGERESLEMIAAMSLGLSLTHVRTGYYSEDEQKEILDEMDRLGGRVRMFALPFGQDTSDERKYNNQNLNLIHQYVAESNCHVFVCDLFHMSLEQTNPDDVTRALYKMKAICKATKTHGFLVHQLRKDVELNSDPRPTRESISGVGSWIDVADTVLAFHRPGLYSGQDDTIEIHCLKQRKGPWPFVIQCDWEGEYGIIANGRIFDIGKPNERSAVDEFLDDQSQPRQRRGRRRY
jgi:archaellum biogenesis ATPase FlaH